MSKGQNKMANLAIKLIMGPLLIKKNISESQPVVFYTNAVVTWLVSGSMLLEIDTFKDGIYFLPTKLYLCIKRAQHS